MIRSPPPLFTPCHFPQRKRAQTRRIPFSEASETGFGGGTLWYVFAPQNRTIRFPPPFANSQLLVTSNWGLPQIALQKNQEKVTDELL